MKISVITLHRVFNYGSVLQAYATQEVLKKAGYDVEVIDYITEQRTNKRLFFDISDSLKNKFFLKYCYLVARAVSICIKKITFGFFLNKYINLSNKKYISVNDLVKNTPISDIYVTGSDQVWNSVYNEGIDRGFFLDFLPENAKRVSFVSSFGKEKLDNYEVEKTKEYLEKYKAISVREDKAANIISDLGLEKPIQLIDPTLQLTRDEWLNIASKRLVKEPYLILMLLYNEDNNATEYARRIADEKGLKLVKISWEMKKPHLVDKLYTHRSPEDFLSLFANADFVVTNSFHGLAFSINLHRQFIVVPRNEYNSRIESLLTLTNLNQRMVNCEQDANLCMNSIIDYDSVEKCLETERKKAKYFIKSLEKI